jgi:hypothetical protein
MKAASIVTSFICAAVLLTSCTRQSHPAKPLPPGQAKKIYGTKSAKPFAPGQQKKHKKHL